MKTKEEIEQLAESEYGTEIGSIRGSNPYDLEKDRKNGYIKGYTQCQKDMIKESNYAKKGDYCAVCGSTEFHNDEEE
jgi:hypothetical protein